MPIDYTSLLFASAASGLAILTVMVLSWTNTRKERHLIFSAFGTGLITLSLVMMGLRNGRFDLLTLTIPFSVLLVGITFIHASIRAFLKKPGQKLPIVAGFTAFVATNIPFFFGLMGLGGVIINVSIAAMLALCAYEFLSVKNDWRTAALAIASLYALMALSYSATSVLLILQNEWIAYPVEDSWWDGMNAIVVLLGVSGIGTLTLSMHFARVIRKHYNEANTDPLTGVLNRRALFEKYNEDAPIPGTSVLQFDLDYFKQINDHFGHAQGDKTLVDFTRILRAHCCEGDVVARIGGEEFCMVLPWMDIRTARTLAERIRTALAEQAIPYGQSDAVLTASVGLAVGGEDEPFHSVLSRADAALYKAKNAGRDRIHQADTTLAA